MMLLKMAEKDQNDMSMDEILNSIRKYVNPTPSSTHPSTRENASQKTESEDQPRTSSASDSEIIRLSPLNESPHIEDPVSDREHKLKDLENLKMPNFFQKAYRNAEPAYESTSFSNPDPVHIAPAAPPQNLEVETMEQKNTQPLENNEDSLLSKPVEDASKQTFSLFRDKAQAIIQQSEHKNNPKTQPESTLDFIMQNAIKSAVADWVNNHLQGIVESIVEKEIHKLTASLVSSENDGTK